MLFTFARKYRNQGDYKKGQYCNEDKDSFLVHDLRRHKAHKASKEKAHDLNRLHECVELIRRHSKTLKI